MRELINTYGCYSLIRLHTHKDTQMSRHTSQHQITKSNVKSCAVSVVKEGLCSCDLGDKLVILQNEWLHVHARLVAVTRLWSSPGFGHMTP